MGSTTRIRAMLASAALLATAALAFAWFASGWRFEPRRHAANLDVTALGAPAEARPSPGHATDEHAALVGDPGGESAVAARAESARGPGISLRRAAFAGPPAHAAISRRPAAVELLDAAPVHDVGVVTPSAPREASSLPPSRAPPRRRGSTVAIA